MRNPHPALIPAAVALACALTYLLHGFDGTLLRDDAIYMYGAQQLIEGVPPYVSIFDHKGPVAAFLDAFCLLAGRTFGAGDDVLSIRVGAWVLLSLLHAPLYLLARKLTGSAAAAAITVAAFLTFWGFGVHVVSGPRAKSWAVMLMVAHFWLTSERRWVLAGVFGALAALTWQPLAAMSGMSGVLALVQPEGGARVRAALRHAGGFALPCLLLAGYFQYHDAVGPWLEGMVTFNLEGLARSDVSLFHRTLQIGYSVLLGCHWAAALVVIGLGTLAGVFAVRVRRLREAVAGPDAVVWMSLPAPVLWSLADYQSFPDFFVFLPFAALGCGIAFGALAQRAPPPRRPALGAVVAGLLLLAAGLAYAGGRRGLGGYVRDGLVEQRRWSERLEDVLGGGGLAAVGVPEALVLLRRRNFSRFIYLGGGVERRAAGGLPGGAGRWLETLQRSRPAAVVVTLEDWSLFGGGLRALLAEEFEYEPIGEWRVFVRR